MRVNKHKLSSASQCKSELSEQISLIFEVGGSKKEMECKLANIYVKSKKKYIGRARARDIVNMYYDQC